MPKHGEFRWFERIEVEGDRIVKREKYLQRYEKENSGWSGYRWEGWYDVPTEQEINDVEPKEKDSECIKQM